MLLTQREKDRVIRRLGANYSIRVAEYAASCGRSVDAIIAEVLKWDERDGKDFEVTASEEEACRG